jgi:hypothetical protein
MAIRPISLPFEIFYGHLVYFVASLVHFSNFGMLFQEKSGNHVDDVSKTVLLHSG